MKSSELNDDAKEEISLWLNTFSRPSSFDDDPRAAALELSVIHDALVSVMATSPSRIRSVFHRVKQTAQTRAWPTSKQIHDAASFLQGKGSQDAVGAQRGDRSTLTYDELRLLDDKILPTAQSWLSIPGLRQHGVQTLEYWGEDVKS